MINREQIIQEIASQEVKHGNIGKNQRFWVNDYLRGLSDDKLAMIYDLIAKI